MVTEAKPEAPGQPDAHQRLNGFKWEPIRWRKKIPAGKNLLPLAKTGISGAKPVSSERARIRHPDAISQLACELGMHLAPSVPMQVGPFHPGTSQASAAKAEQRSQQRALLSPDHLSDLQCTFQI